MWGQEKFGETELVKREKSLEFTFLVTCDIHRGRWRKMEIDFKIYTFDTGPLLVYNAAV